MHTCEINGFGPVNKILVLMSCMHASGILMGGHYLPLFQNTFAQFFEVLGNYPWLCHLLSFETY